MYKWFLTAAAVCLLGVSAVAVAEDSYYLELPTKGVTSSRKITVDVPGENPVEDGVNPLTGESWYGNYYPILVNIDAHPEALPHWGVASADISYEMPVPGGRLHPFRDALHGHDSRLCRPCPFRPRADGQPARDLGRRMGVLRLAELGQRQQHHRRCG